MNSHQKEMITLETGEFFGEFSLFSRSDFLPYSVRVSAKAELLLIPESALSPILKKHPALKKKLRQRDQDIDVVIRPTGEEKDKKSDRAYFPSPARRLGHGIGRSLRRYPFFEQQSASDCGAACLVMSARYWGKRISVNRLREMANVNRDGASMKGLITAAENTGFSTRAVQATLEGLIKQPLPAIAHWEGKHFVVIWEITGKHVIIGDPATLPTEMANRTALEVLKNALKARPNYHEKYKRYHDPDLRKLNRLSFSSVVRSSQFYRTKNSR